MHRQIREQRKEYRKKNKRLVKGWSKKWREKNPKYFSMWAKTITGKASLKKNIAKWHKTLAGKLSQQKAQAKYKQTINGIIAKRRGDAKFRKTNKAKIRDKKIRAKRKGLGFIPLNEYCEGYEGHHISGNFVIYIPEKLHRNYCHSIWTWEGMEKINKLALKYL